MGGDRRPEGVPAGTGAATAPASSPQKGQGSGSRQQSRRENGQVRESSARTESRDSVSDRRPLHTRTPPEQAQAPQRRYSILSPSSPFTSCSSRRAALREANSSVRRRAGLVALTPRPHLSAQGEPWGPCHHQHTYHTTHTDEWAPWVGEACDDDEVVC